MQGIEIVFTLFYPEFSHLPSVLPMFAGMCSILAFPS